MIGTNESRKAVVLRPSDLPRHDRGGGASTTPLVGPSCGASAFINGITSFGPGTEIPFHSHNCEESVMLLEGDAMLDIEGQESLRLQPLDTTWLPPNLSHRFRNLSNTQAMKILWIYARIDATRTLTESGQTNFVSAEHNKK
ncbi:cupin domain-containing protein [Candidimonas humi]|jgi:quercetin dioxygenase-like cupin family protein|uniref:Cupin domain-containing protein n=1 Tax=Candidimonas humi TaxID=683355 RepID=A0ABV8P1Y7_9BURK|nr:cupin domain-containing protein [Candidimonas humi]MBV6305491.1 cupin domain-containing protein [Candidimonas humi]